MDTAVIPKIKRNKKNTKEVYGIKPDNRDFELK